MRKNRFIAEPSEIKLKGSPDTWLNKNRSRYFETIHSDYMLAIRKAAKQTDINPTEAQKKAGTYRKGKVLIQGLRIVIENPKGSIRSGIAKDGKRWEIKMPHHYGYIKNTVSEADGDHIDIFLGTHPENDIIHIVNQVKPNGDFDEHKVMLGWDSPEQARQAYMAAYAKNWNGFGGIATLSMDEFKHWLEQGDSGDHLHRPLPT